MALTRLKNVFTSKTGRCLYVNPDDFDASDSFDNRGNSPNRPFKTIQRALIESARFSYRTGQYNDAFEAFTIVLYPGDYIIDNRPGVTADANGYAYLPADISELNSATNFDLQDAQGNPNPNNVLYRFNSVEGGVIVPRGTSIVGMDLRKTKLRPLYVPNPEQGAIARSAIFRITGGCYFWQFSFFDGPNTGVYTDPAQPSASSPPTYSHHKLTCFEYADGVNPLSSYTGTDGNALTTTKDLDLYYEKIAKAFADIPDSTGTQSADELQARVEENRIVGPQTAGPVDITTIFTDFVSANVFTTTAEVTTASNHNLSVGTPVLISGVTGTAADRFNGSYFISEIVSPTQFRYIIKDPGTGAPAGNPTAVGAQVQVEVDNVDSSSPYIFNISLRSTWGTCGMHADGSKATGFKSMVVAQFTGVSLQKDDNAFIKWNGSAYGSGSHTDGDSIYKAEYRNFHVKCSNDSVIQAVSVFAVGFADHFVALSGGDQSITNSNSNFGSCALRAKGFKTEPFTQDKAGQITHIIPPQKLGRTYASVPTYTFSATINDVNVDHNQSDATYAASPHGIAAGDYIKFIQDDAQESYKVTLVNGTTGALTLNRGYRGTTGSGITVFKGTVNEIPVGYVAFDVQKIKANATQNNGTHANSTAYAAGASIVANGKAYYTAAGGTTDGLSNPPTHTTGTASDGTVTWSYIGNADTRLYLYGYTSLATKPPYKLQGFNIGARKQDKLYVSLIDSLSNPGNSVPIVCSALVSPDDSTSPADNVYTEITTNQFTPGDPNHPLQYDSELNNWYVRVTAATSGDSTVNAATGYKGIHYHIGNEGVSGSGFYASTLFTGAGYMRRIPDNRSSRDRTYRIRYVVDSSVSLSRDPINGYIVQPRNVPTGQSYGDVYYIYDIEIEKELKKSVQNGVYYCTLLKGSISPTNASVNSFSFSQNINDLYPTLDKDNPTEDPDATVSVASNTTIGLVTSTDGSIEDKSRSITKESINAFIQETRNNYVNAGNPNSPQLANYITLEARDGEADEIDLALRMVPVATSPTDTELRRPSILRSGNHTFEYVGYGPGNYSTGLPSVQNRVLTEQEILISQSQKEEGGIAFYSGLNSNGDLFIGNTKISSVTGEEANLDTPTLAIVGETTNLRPTFDEIIVRDKITIESQTLESDFKGKLRVRKEAAVEGKLTAADVTIGVTGEASKNIDVLAADPTGATVGDTGDWKLKENPTRGQYLGHTYLNNNWVKFGLSDTGNLSITGGSGTNDSTGDLEFNNGLGIKINGSGTFQIGTGLLSTGGNVNVGNTLNVAGTLNVNGSTLATDDSTFNLIDTTATTINFGGAATDVQIGASTGTTTINNNLSLSGGLTIGNALTVGASQVIQDTGGVATLQNIDSIDATTESTIESAIDTLGNLTSASSLSTIGTVTTGTWNASVIGRTYGGTGINTSTLSNGQLLIGSSTGFAKATLGSSTGISITNGANSITINNTGVTSFNNPSGFYNGSVNSTTGGVTFTIGESSNAYGRRYVSTSAPTTQGSNGDVWYRY